MRYFNYECQRSGGKLRFVFSLKGFNPHKSKTFQLLQQSIQLRESFRERRLKMSWNVPAALVCFQKNADRRMTLFFNPLLPSGSESVRSVLIVLPKMLLLVSGEVHQVPQQERVHHGERPHHPEALTVLQHRPESFYSTSKKTLLVYFSFRLPFMGKTSAFQPKTLSCFS